MVKLSIIVPCYGVEKYLDRCINSLIKQTLKDIEIILVDDKSPDNVPQIIDKYASIDNRIKTIHKKQNEGLGYARNTGMNIATGDYLAFVDGDDFVDINMYETLYNDAINECADIVFCNFQKEKIDGTWDKCIEVKNRNVYRGDKISNLMLDMIASPPHVKIERKYQMSVWHGIYKRSIIEKNNICFLSEREIASEDIPFNIEYISNCNTIIYRPECYYHYCLNGNSLTKKFLPEKFKRYIKLYNHIHKFVKPYGTEGENRLKRFFIGMTRTQILHLAEVNRKDKYNIYEEYATDNIWEEIMNNFKYSYLPLHASLLLLLLLKKQYLLLFLFSKIYLKARN